MKPKTKAAFLHSRWAAYAAAASATTFGAAVAEAEIHYSGPLREKLIPHQHSSVAAEHFALNNGASFSLFAVSSRAAHQYSYAGLVVKNAPVSQGFRAAKFFSYAARLPAGVPVSTGNFERTSSSFIGGNIRTFYGAGAFNDGGQGFVGFKFNTGAGTQYGWARIKLTPNSRDVAMLVVDYAYGDPGEPIATGQKSSAPTQTASRPKEGSLGLLALGGAGLAAWREDRKPAP